MEITEAKSSTQPSSVKPPIGKKRKKLSGCCNSFQMQKKIKAEKIRKEGPPQLPAPPPADIINGCPSTCHPIFNDWHNYSLPSKDAPEEPTQFVHKVTQTDASLPLAENQNQGSNAGVKKRFAANDCGNKDCMRSKAYLNKRVAELSEQVKELKKKVKSLEKNPGNLRLNPAIMEMNRVKEQNAAVANLQRLQILHNKL